MKYTTFKYVSVRDSESCVSVWLQLTGTYYLRIENAEGYVLIAVYLFIYLYAFYSHN